MIFQDLSEEEEMEEEEEEEGEEEEEEEREAMEMGNNSAGRNPGGKEEDLVAESGLSGTEMPGQLLRFAERISDDIQRYFGRKSKEEGSDACNIYEDSCSPHLSGQVLYYSDLVRISQGKELEEEEEEEEGSPASLKPPEQVDGELRRSFCSKDEAEKLGPLAELFEYGLRRCVKQPFSSDKKLRLKYGHVPPMHSRKLPPSFWKEPSLSPICMLNGNPPDFSDLLANWTSETCQEDLNASQEHTGEGNQQILTLENRILEVELHTEKTTGERDALQERLQALEANRKELADEYLVAKNEELSKELLDLASATNSLRHVPGNLPKSNAQTDEPSDELKRVRALVRRLSARKVRPEDVVASEHERQKLEKSVLLSSQSQLQEIEAENSRLQLQLKELNEEYRSRLVQYITDLAVSISFWVVSYLVDGEWGVLILLPDQILNS
ncbi:hypothetical protein JD844_019654 [Phrynosoma platyrhinos]|uniref:DUF4472 domain-containing protein n=1 Tax=Phrynosoma platyrhinos TaxID=52577 RepID=A0ABQ7TQW5_PHRPL|nr:hypothetical protein JD844_019654 [Phrynosoma platyrhinos]